MHLPVSVLSGQEKGKKKKMIFPSAGVSAGVMMMIPFHVLSPSLTWMIKQRVNERHVKTSLLISAYRHKVFDIQFREMWKVVI